MHRHELDDKTIRARSARRDVNNEVHASIILRDIWMNKRPQYSTPRRCLDALNKDDELYKALRHAHTKGKSYGIIRNWRMLGHIDRKPHLTYISYFLPGL